MNLSKNQKIVLGLVGTAVAAGAVYYGYLHREEILSKVTELKEDIKKKKEELGEAGVEKIHKAVDSLIQVLDKYSSGELTASKDAEIERLRSEIAALKSC